MKKCSPVLIACGWILIGLSILVAVRMLPRDHNTYAFVKSLLRRPPAYGPSLTVAVGIMVGLNVLTIPALMIGIYALARRDLKGLPLVIVSLILAFVICFISFLLMNYDGLV